MKIGRLNISFTRSNKASENFKAGYEPTVSTKPKRKTFQTGMYSWKARCAHYDKITDQYSLAKIAPFTLAGLVTANGVFFQPAEKKPLPKSKKSKEAK